MTPQGLTRSCTSGFEQVEQGRALGGRQAREDLLGGAGALVVQPLVDLPALGG